MHWKLLLTLLVIIAIGGLLVFSKTGRSFREKYLDKYIKQVGSYIKVLKEYFVKKPSVNRTLQMTLETDISSLRGQEFKLDGNSFSVSLDYDSILIGGQTINIREGREIDFNSNSMVGSILIDTSGKMKINGYASSLELNDVIFSPKSGEKNVEFSITGTPRSFSLNDIEKDKMSFSSISGSLTLKGLSSLALENDNLNLLYFKGSIEKIDEKVSISGKAEKVNLNGIDLLLKT